MKQRASQTLTTLLSLEANGRLPVAAGFWCYVICPLLIYARHLDAMQFTGWDTFDYQFPKFLYLADSLWSGVIPWWNPFQNAGDFFAAPAILPANPIYLPFVLLTRLMHPMLAYEFSVLVLLLFAIYSFRRLLDSLGHRDLWLHIAGATMFSIGMVGPLLGQSSFVLSLITLVWMLDSALLLFQPAASVRQFFLRGIGIGLVAGAGYIFLNICIGIITIAFVLPRLFDRQRQVPLIRLLARVAVFALPFAVISAAIIWPVIENTREYYRWFAGDLDSPDPRVRFFPPKATDSMFYFGQFSEAIYSTFDLNLRYPKLYSWTPGLGLGALAVLLLPAGRPAITRWLQQKAGWFFGIAVFWLMSQSPKGWFWQNVLQPIPFLNNNRFPAVTVLFAQFCCLLLIISLLSQGWFQQRFFQTPRSRKLFGLAVAIVGGIWGTTPYWILVGLFVVWLESVRASDVSQATTARAKQVRLILVVVAGTLLSKFVLGWNDLKMQPPGELWRAIAERKIEPVFEGIDRIRALPPSNEIERNYPDIPDFMDHRWVTEKHPFTRGYNLFNHPLQSKLKLSPAWDYLAYITDRFELAAVPDRSSYPSDNALLDEVAQRTETAVQAKTVVLHETPAIVPAASDQVGAPGKIAMMTTRPNSIEITVAATRPALIVAMSKFFPGWSVTVDGAPAKLLTANYIAGAVAVPAGVHAIEFRYTPRFAWVASIPFLFALLGAVLCIVLWAISARRSGLSLSSSAKSPI